MTGTRIFGIVLLVVGLVTFAVRGFSFVTHDKVIDVGAIEVTVSLVSVGGMLNPIGTAPTVIDAYFDRLKLSAVDREGLREKLVAARNAHDADAAMVAVYRYLIPLMSAGEIAADFSVFNPTSGVDPHYASERVLTALPDLTLPDVQRITEERSHKVEPLTIHSAYFVSAIPRFVVVGEIRHGDGTRYVERVPIEISSAGSVIYLGR